jgi:hypothetical protein
MSGDSEALNAATVRRKSSTSLRSLTVAFSTSSEAASTVCAELRVCVTPEATSPSADTTARAPAAALATLCEISPVASSCCSMAPTTSEVWALISCMRWVIARMAATASPVELCTDEISLVISPVALAVCTASDFTSDATTAKPRPASPARAASMVALSASRLVCSAMS